MTAKSSEVGTASLGGLVVGGLVAVILSMVDLPFSTALGAFIGGVAAAYLLYGKIGQACLAGATSGLLSTPFFLGVSQILLIFELIPLPSGPTPPLSALQTAIVVIVLMNLAAGAIGGFLTAVVRHPRPGAGLPPPPPPPGYAPGQVRYCVQCGAQLPAGSLICPHCNARQPQ